MKPTIGRVVWYRSKTGNYTLTADVISTKDKLYRPGVEAGFMPDLDSDTHVHLLVKTAGKPDTRLPETDKSITSKNLGGTYVEHNIPFWDPDVDEWRNSYAGERPSNWADHDQPAGTWTWPRRDA
jgi:hypothetical protein